jgi:high affinity Mn2+ porin
MTAFAFIVATLFPRTQDPQEEKNVPEDWSLHAQGTVVTQEHGAFPSSYSGPHSFSDRHERATSMTGTLFLGRRLWTGAALYMDPEVAGGEGLSRTLGVAGFPNGETTRVAKTTPTPYLARLYVEQSFALSDQLEPVDAGPNQLGGKECPSRLTLTAGKVAALDFFDANRYSHDPRTQFMNWALMADGAWDYPADTRGYTWGAAVELIDPEWALRYGLFAMPRSANGMVIDTAFPNAHAQALELEKSVHVLPIAGKVRLLGFVNNADMGHYRATIDDPSLAMDVTRSRRADSVKFGFGANAEQPITEDFGAFARVGWNDGRTESFAFTEIDRTAQVGLSARGAWWDRPSDTVGLAAVVNGLSPDHESYLRRGGLGFILGDGRLNYGPEAILETYYAAKFKDVLSVSFDYQLIEHPGYNRDRGPVSVFAIRVHVDF